ncbi:Homeobox-leucine zipper HAT14-like protein [Gossypium australe]|uniref:Homeobox-leucine zipper HAT14-like protein n=1 Tax=Gossypium australe TaxID=47621 RepID=A0A5B6WTA8_9ROSI|nr:Homeobox-leucine zipper HAT14-like protein [Gossypium australe]
MASNLIDGVFDSRFFSTKKISVILDDNNYLLWYQQFARFEQQDGALAPWLLSSVSQAVLPHLIGLDTGAQIWNALVNLYGSKTTSREHEHVTAILNGLSPKYESVITIITTTQIPYNVQGVTTMLLDAEAQQVTIVEAPSSANMVSHQHMDIAVNSAPTPTYRHLSVARGRGRGYRPPPSPQANVCMFSTGSPIAPWVSSSMPMTPPAVPSS